MSKKLLIDAAHKEETRVALIDEKKRLVEYDIDTLHKQTIKGNVYLAKVMRVEPSLQAAFVDYGGNRHGFLAFSEIHPDYFRIPVSDREVLEAKLQDAVELIQEIDIPENDDKTPQDEEDAVSTIAGESVDHSDEDQEDARRRRPALHRMYKIQEVIHKNQILLIQATKEERGQKGAALTTYMSLAGRYCVLMPNSPQAGGISRKISNPKERKKLREVLVSLEMPKEMGMIIRTAGRGHTKTEIKRDATYLMRQWGEIRDLTLKSMAPSLIYQEDSIIKRVIRDQYNKDIEEVLVEGEECHKSAKAFMKKLLPSHAKNIKLYKSERVPLFIEHKVEQQIEKMHESTVMLPSGGSIVINPTEALVSIDINSGRATKERHISDTALNTNLEAAVEIARQVRLRDLAGLVVIDFIDMDDRRHTGQVERKVREAFKNDRARVQMGKISPFGLLELSRQRLRPSMLETSSIPCPHCHATGYVRSTESMSLLVLRSLEEEGITNRSAKIKTVVPSDVAFYILNEKRTHLAKIEERHSMTVQIFGDPNFIAPQFKMFQLERKTKEGTPEENATEIDLTQLRISTQRHSSQKNDLRGQGKREDTKDQGRRNNNRRPQKKDSGSETQEIRDKKQGDSSENKPEGKNRNNRNRRRGGNRNRHQKDTDDKGKMTTEGNKTTPLTQNDKIDSEKPSPKKAAGPTPKVAENSTPKAAQGSSPKKAGVRNRRRSPSNKNSENKTLEKKIPEKKEAEKKSGTKTDIKAVDKKIKPKAKVANSEIKKEEKSATVKKEAVPSADDKPKGKPRRRSWLKKLLD